MRVVVLLAAMAALWVQPASAAVLIYGVGTGTLAEGNNLPTTGRYDVIAYLPDEFVNGGSASFSTGVAGFCPYRSCSFEASGGTFQLVTGSINASLDISGVVTSWTQLSGNSAPNITAFPSSPVPEPATWAMMLLGFGAIGAAMRRRHVTRSRWRFSLA